MTELAATINQPWPASLSCNIFIVFIVSLHFVYAAAALLSALYTLSGVVQQLSTAYNIASKLEELAAMQLTRKRTITDQQKSFVDYVVSEQMNPTAAARMAGYAHPKQSAYILTRNPAVATLLRQSRQTMYQTDLASLAAHTLKNVMKDVDAPASAKVSAARTALELAGDLGANAIDQANGKSLAEMSPEELGSLIDTWEGERAAKAKDVSAQPTAQELL